jgi:phosphoglycolate phosphatase
MTFPFAIVGFDLDGTLVDTSGDLAAAVNVALADAGRPLLTAEQVTPMIGGGAKNMLHQALEATGGCDDAEFRRLYHVLLSFYEANLAVHSRPFPYAVAALDELLASGVRLGIVTNKFERFATSLLAQLGVSDRFASVIGGDTMGKGFAKPHPAGILRMIERCGGGQAAFVGDSIYDMQAARAARIPAIAVSFGFLTQPLETLGANAVIDDYRALIPTLEALCQQ